MYLPGSHIFLSRSIHPKLIDCARELTKREEREREKREREHER